jgi:hypothetical protein
VAGKLQHAAAIFFRGNMYVGGYEETQKGLEFKLGEYDADLQLVKEVSRHLGKQKFNEFYPPHFDTTHGYLGVEIQRADLNEKRATLLRYNQDLKIVTSADNIEIVRINSFAAFNEEKIYYRNQLYLVREAKDSVGRFYFFRYDLKDSSAAFNYDLKWQFNFDQHTYHRIHPVYVNADFVYLYVICLDGEKKGQWMLLLDTETGNLTKAIKLNKSDAEFCVLSRFEVYGSKRDMALAGMIYPASGVDVKTGKFAMNYQAAKAVNALFCFIDSTGNVSTRLINFMNVPNDVLKEKEHKEMLFRCNQLERSESGFNLNYECLYKGTDGVYRTYGFLLCKLNQTPEGTFKAENNAFLTCYHNEKKNPFCKQMANQYLIDALGNGDRIFFRDPILQNFTPMGMDISMLKKLAWNIGYFDNKKTGHLELIQNIMKNYSWETSPLKTISEYSRASVFHLRSNRFVLFYTLKDESGFQISLIDL